MLAFSQRMRRRRPHRMDKVTNTISAEGTAILCFPPDGSSFRGMMTTNSKEHMAMDEDSPYVLYGRETPTPGQYKVTVADLETGLQYHMDAVQLRGELRKRGRSMSTSPEIITHSTSAAIPIGGGGHAQGHGGQGVGFEDIFLLEHSCPPNLINGGFLEENSELSPVGSDSTRLSSTPSHNSPLSPLPSAKDDAPLEAFSNPQFSLEFESEEDTLQFTANTVHRGQKADMIIQRLMAGSKLGGTKCVVLVGPLRFSVSDTVTTDANMAWSM
ncbi:uncharacterized protein LOC132201304 [Neocloeon triangulifer]|uniref:uncharacterized protein LOC132201304 n=1 Tax=Neocloeon triangulifer TaxID=2078957 RepID=UPI00286F6800|nr:uncharacterized protein LOC132201304 [Neocloeon triangulifer]XP_059483345.1 uncharacterized protein LOC132201304 [Neocloeon triangulifer]